MARRLGYGGIANTNGARDFSSKAAAALVAITFVNFDSIADPSFSFDSLADEVFSFDSKADQNFSFDSEVV